MLFEDLNNIYVADTSALIDLERYFKHDRPAFKAIWDEVEEMIGHGNFRTIDFVEGEINEYGDKQDFLNQWVKKWKKKLVVTTDSDCFNAARPIINAEYHSGFFKAAKQAEGKEEADPYLIAYCKIHDCMLITSESKTATNKIPKVAAKNGVKCIDLYEFIEERGLRMERKK